MGLYSNCVGHNIGNFNEMDFSSFSVHFNTVIQEPYIDSGVNWVLDWVYFYFHTISNFKSLRNLGSRDGSQSEMTLFPSTVFYEPCTLNKWSKYG